MTTHPTRLRRVAHALAALAAVLATAAGAGHSPASAATPGAGQPASMGAPAGGPLARQGDQQPAGNARTWSVQPANAEGADGRASFDYHLAAGQSVEDHVQVNNFGEEPLTLRVYGSDAVNTPDGGFTLLPGNEAPADVGAWTSLDTEVTVPAQDHVLLDFTLTVPDNATPGDHPGGIVASATTLATDQAGNQVLVDNRVGARVYLRVGGELNPVLEIRDLRVHHDDTPVPFTQGRITATYTVTNTGNIRLQAQQQLTTSGPLGLLRRTTTLDTLPEVLPGETVTATATTRVAALGIVTTELTLQPVPPLAGDPTTTPVLAQETVWALPWSEALVLALVGAAVWAWWWLRRRRRHRNQAALADAVAKAREEALEEARRDQGQATDSPATDSQAAARGPETEAEAATAGRKPRGRRRLARTETAGPAAGAGGASGS